MIRAELKRNPGQETATITVDGKEIGQINLVSCPIPYHTRILLDWGETVTVNIDFEGGEQK